MHHEWEARKVVLDGFDNVEVDTLSTSELVGSVAGSDGACKGVAACAGHEFLGLLWISQTSVGFIHIDIFLDTAKHSELSFDGDANSMCTLDNTLGDRNVLFEVFVGCIDHDRAVEARVNTVIAGLFITMVEVNSKDSFRVEGISRADHRLEECLVGISACTLAELDDEWSLGVDASAEHADNLFQVVDVVCSDGILAVRVREQLLRGDYHNLPRKLFVSGRFSDATLRHGSPTKP